MTFHYEIRKRYLCADEGEFAQISRGNGILRSILYGQNGGQFEINESEKIDHFSQFLIVDRFPPEVFIGQDFVQLLDILVLQLLQHPQTVHVRGQIVVQNV